MRKCIRRTIILETAVGSQKSTQALGAPRIIKKCLITNRVTTNFLISPGTPIPYASFLRPTAASRLKGPLPSIKMVFFAGRHSTTLSFCLRARETITSHFRIPSSGHLGPIFTRTILRSTPSATNLGANSGKLVFREP